MLSTRATTAAAAAAARRRYGGTAIISGRSPLIALAPASSPLGIRNLFLDSCHSQQTGNKSRDTTAPMSVASGTAAATATTAAEGKAKRATGGGATSTIIRSEAFTTFYRQVPCPVALPLRGGTGVWFISNSSRSRSSMAPPAGTVTNTASISRCLGFAASSSSAVVGVGVDDKNTDGDDHDDAHGGGGGGRDFAIIEEGTERYLVAARGLEAGRVLFDHVGGSLSGERTRHSIQIQGGLHMEADSDLIFMNHSCEPNCQLEVVSVDEATGIPVGEKSHRRRHHYLRVTVRAAEIPQDEGLTIDYNAMEINMVCTFDCACGADKCKGRVSGFANLPRTAQKEYLDERWATAPAAAAPAAAATAAAAAAGNKSQLPGPPPLVGAVATWAKRNVI
ncbi:unnamed protein product [Pylaiella littoralis]